jgi:hypothetical protein
MRETMLAKRSYDARRAVEACRRDEPPTNAFECGLDQGWQFLREAEAKATAGSGFLRRHDVHKPFRDILLALGTFKAGDPRPLLALRGETPNTTNAADPLDALIRAVLRLCVQKLKNSGFSVAAAAKHVADHAKAQGLARTMSTVRKNYYDRTDEAAADWYALIAVGVPQDGDVHQSREDALAWLRRVNFFAALPESYRIPVPE